MHTHTRTHTHRDSHTHARTHARTHTHTHIHTHTHTHARHTRRAYQDNQSTEGKLFFFKRKVFKEDLKELTEAEWRTERGSWFRITGAW